MPPERREKDHTEDVTNPQGPRGLRRVPRSDRERAERLRELEERTLPDGLSSLQIGVPEESSGGDWDGPTDPGIKKNVFVEDEPKEALSLGHMMADEIGLVVRRGTPLFDFLKGEVEKGGDIGLDGIEERYKEFIKKMTKI